MSFPMYRYKKIFRTFSFLFMVMMFSLSLKAESPPPPPSISNPFVMTMVIVIIILALIIGLLANVVMGAAFVQREKEKEDKQQEENKFKPSVSTVVIILLLLSLPGLAQSNSSEAAASATNAVEGVSQTAFYMIAGVIFLELVVLLGLLYNLRLILNIERKKKVVVAKEKLAAVNKPRVSWWDKFNQFKPIEQEVDIDLGHNYDGIRELDNRLPPWWIYGFYCTIFFACIYLWRFHVSHTAPLSGEEYQISMQQAAIQKEAYLKKAANNIDETNVRLLTTPGDLAAGKGIFEATCFPCHGKNGEGIVGPNLTDEYWIHGGSINDVFKTIKYGYPEKGMKSWKDDYSPTQMAELASYIKSLRGTNPANPKAPQGIIYSDTDASLTGALKDSTTNSNDSTKKTTQ